MKRLLIVLIALVAIFALVLPASAAELKFGGYFGQKVYSTNNQHDGYDKNDDNTNFFYTRMRLYFDAIGSENIKAVTKFELDDFWGNKNLGSLSADGGSNFDAAGLEIKNAYIDFIVPDTTLNIKMGVIGAKLDKPGLVFNDDTSGIFAAYKYDQWYFAGVYSRLGDSGDVSSASTMTTTNSHDDVDLYAFAVNYNMEGVFTALNFAYIAGPGNMHDGTTGGLNFDQAFGATDSSKDTNLFVLSLDVDYGTDMYSFYADAAKNFGSAKGVTGSPDFEGYALMGGGTFNATDTITVGADVYYASGQKIGKTNNIEAFVTAGAPTGRNVYNMDEVVFPGWFDDDTSTINTYLGVPGSAGFAVANPTGAGGLMQNNVSSTGLGTNAGYCLNNIWAVGAHADFKPLDKTLVQVGGAYMGFVEKVYSDYATGKQDDALGSSFYARLSQGIVDGLTLKASAGYLLADDGFSSVKKSSDDAYRLAMGLFWSW